MSRPCPPVNRYICIYSLYINIYKYMHICIAQINYYRNIWHNLPRTHAFPSQMVFLFGFVSQKYFPETAFFVTEWLTWQYFDGQKTIGILSLQKRNWAACHFWQCNPVLQRCCIIWRRQLHSQTNVHFLRCQ